MILDPVKLFIIISGTLITGGLAWLASRGWAQRLMLFALLGGLAFYSGIGIASPDVDPVFIVFYFALFGAVIVGFHLGRPLFLSVSIIAERKLSPALRLMQRGHVWRMVIFLYVLVSAFPLLWPEFRLQLLLSPPAPDLTTLFFERFTAEVDVLSKMIGYIQLLVSPFFFWALYQLRDRLRWVILIFFFLLYMNYVADAYVGRGNVMMHLSYIMLALWFLRPQYRGRMVLCVVALTPLMFLVLYWYERIRIGGTFEFTGFIHALNDVLNIELSFAKNVGMPLWEIGARVDLIKYFTWLATLPIPKILTGPIEGARINYEISEIILGRAAGAQGFYVVLPGLVSESIYIYGSWFYWVHGLFIGVISSFYARLAERIPQFLFLYIHIVLLFGYVLNRGGIAAMLPPIINHFLLFYLFLFLIVFRVHKQA